MANLIATVQELKSMGDIGAQEINRRFDIVFPGGYERVLSCQAAALELYIGLASTRLYEITDRYARAPYIAASSPDGSILGNMDMEYWSEYVNAVAEVRSNTDMHLDEDLPLDDQLHYGMLIPPDAHRAARHHNIDSAIDSNLKQTVTLIRLRRHILSLDEEERESMVGRYWGAYLSRGILLYEDDEHVLPNQQPPEGSISRRIWDANLNDETLDRLIEMNRSIRDKVYGTDFIDLFKNIRIAMEGTANNIGRPPGIRQDDLVPREEVRRLFNTALVQYQTPHREQRGEQQRDVREYEQRIQRRERQRGQRQERERIQRQERERIQRQERERIRNQEQQTMKLLKEALKADDYRCTHTDAEGRPIDSISFEPLDTDKDIIVRFYDIETRKGYCFALSTIMAHWGNMMETRQYRVTGSDSDGVVLPGTTLLTIPEPMIFGEKFILPSNAFKTFQNITEAGKTTFYLAPSKIVVSQIGVHAFSENTKTNVMLYELRHSPRA